MLKNEACHSDDEPFDEKDRQPGEPKYKWVACKKPMRNPVFVGIIRKLDKDIAAKIARTPHPGRK
jgi:hypothetical protein